MTLGNAMRIFIFKSQANSKLRAFAGDPGGRTLPAQFAPWHAVGVVAEGRDPPYKFSRGTIEQAIEKNGFQLFRDKPKTAAAS
jgi:hypothetical protein